jgi:hypothetical protein
MSKHSLNTKSVFLNAKSPAGNVGFAADRIDVLDLFMRETSRGMSRTGLGLSPARSGPASPDGDPATTARCIIAGVVGPTRAVWIIRQLNLPCVLSV